MSRIINRIQVKMKWKTSPDSLRKNIAIVLRDTVLFSNTIENNIKYANLEAYDEDKIVVMDQSQVVEMGNHEELLAVISCNNLISNISSLSGYCFYWLL